MRKSVLVVLVFLVASFVMMSPASAAKSCNNCPPTLVTVNNDGTVTASTTATTPSNCVGTTSPTKGACDLYVEGAISDASYYSDGGPMTVAMPSDCPCVAQFRVHSGQWAPYSAKSAAFG